MSLEAVLTGITLEPVELLFECFFTAFRKAFSVSGWSVLGLSALVCFCLIPLRTGRKQTTSVARSAVSMLFPAVCFAASWRFFASLSVIQGEAFGAIRDLGAPDRLLGAVSLLPLLAGGFLLAAGQTGLPDASPVRRLCLAAGAVAAAVLLYSQAAAMTLMWTGIGAGLLICRIVSVRKAGQDAWGVKDRKTFLLLLFAGLYLSILTGLVIPSEILNASPGEFVNVHEYLNPDHYLVQTALLGFGLFTLWPLVYAAALSSRGLRNCAWGMTAAAACAAVNYMLFGRHFGIISSLLRYEVAVTNSAGQAALNAGCLALLTAGVILAVKKWPAVGRIVCAYGCVAMTVMSVMNISSLEEKTKQLREISAGETDEAPSFHLDRAGKNVVVIMLDRAISGFVPFMMRAKPELLRQFDGFTYYPNALSYGFHTNIAAPALYGGYEYTPDGLESRPGLSLKDKHNEALQIMPVNFLNAGFEVTVCDAPYANYQWVPDLSIYQDHPEIRTFHTIGYFDEYKQETRQWEEKSRNRNLFCYSLFRTAPALLQELLYDGGYYLEPDGAAREAHSLYGVSTDFLNSYMAMKNLGTMTEITEDGRDTFLLLTNEMTHNVIELQEPDYTPARTVDNQAWDQMNPVRAAEDGRELDLQNAPELLKIHYHSDMAAFLLLGQWFDELRQAGVYDQTRIILVADHGCYLGLTGIDLRDGRTNLPEVWGSTPEQWADTTSYNPLLMMKDFGATGFTTQPSFMTNADTPLLAFGQILPDPVNPFTGKSITAEMKNAEEQHLIESSWDIATNNGAFFSDPIRITFRGRDIFSRDGWILTE